MKKKIFLHIGTNKTGTSAIQKFCNAERESLLRNGLLYPQTGCSGEAHYVLSDVLGFTHSKLSVAERAELKRGLSKSLNREIKRSAIDKVVLSSENFILDGDPHEVAEFFKNYDVYVVVYLRRHDGWWVSAYNQAVRQVKAPCWAVGIEGFVSFQEKNNPRYGDYRYLVDRWAAAFGADKIIVRPYESVQNRPHVIADFFDVIGCPALAPVDSPRVNESVDAWSLRIIEIAQRAEISDEVRRRIIDYTLASGKGGRPYRVSADLARKFIEKWQSDYEYIARTYLGREDGRLFYEELPEGSDRVVNSSPLPREIMAWTARALDPLSDKGRAG